MKKLYFFNICIFTFLILTFTGCNKNLETNISNNVSITTNKIENETNYDKQSNTKIIHYLKFDNNEAFLDDKKIIEYNYVWHIDSKGDYKDVKDSPAEYYTGDKPDETNGLWIAHDIKYFPMIDKSKFYKTTVKNDPEWETNYENEKYKDFVFANLPRSYEGDDFPEYMMHKEDEAYNNPCLHISAPGTYELNGKWNGQIFVDLGKDSITNPDKRINLILNNLEVNCSVASAINIYRAYECDNKWEERKESTKDIDLKDTGVNIIIKDNSKNIINGANVYRIKKTTYKKDSKEQKTAIKYDGAIESNITFSINGETQNNGELYVNAVLEGISSSLHLAINGGKIYINADNDGINCNEDNVSIIEINDCYLMVNAGLSYQGDGIDSNGYIVINDGDIVTIGNYKEDPGIDATKGLYLNGGKVIALGQPDNIDWPKTYTNENTDQSYVFKSFDDAKSENSRIFVVDENGTEILNFSETDIPHINNKKRPFFATLISNPDIKKDKKYDVIIQ